MKLMLEQNELQKNFEEKKNGKFRSFAKGEEFSLNEE